MKPQSKRRRLTAINQIKPYFANSVRSIGSADVEQWASIRARKASARTFNVERETLIQILNCAMREGVILDNPAEVVARMKQTQAKIITPAKQQFAALVGQMRAEPYATEAAKTFASFSPTVVAGWQRPRRLRGAT